MGKARQPDSVETALKWLRKGNSRYARDRMQRDLQDADRRKKTAKKQNPWAIVLTCIDSRVTPELIFDCGIGELFVARVAGNIANVCTLASIEYAVKVLNVKLIVVLGHTNCGAIKAALAGDAVSYNIDQLLGHLMPVADKFGSQWSKAKTDKEKYAIQDKAAKHNVKNVANCLCTQSSIIECTEDVIVQPAMYSTGTGKVAWEKCWA